MKPKKDSWSVFAACLIAFFLVAIIIGSIVLVMVFAGGDKGKEHFHSSLFYVFVLEQPVFTKYNQMDYKCEISWS